MASRIESLLEQILSAVYGEEVRGSIHDAIEECYTDVSSAQTLAQDATDSANTAASRANVAADNATTAATSATNAAEAAVAAADGVEEATSDATTAAQTARSAAENANAKATIANTAAESANTAATNATAAKTGVEEAIAQVQAATTAATTATDNANSATTAATDAASAANTAANRANTAAQTAEDMNADITEMYDDLQTMHADVSQLITDTNIAINTANTAANSANSAATSANSAASTANTAASTLAQDRERVNTAIDNANSQASSAETAAAAATSAASSANSYATAANTAATRANTAADRANSAAQAIEGTTASASTVSYGTAASVETRTVDNHLNINFYIPEGKPGKNFVISGDAYSSLAELEVSVTDPQEGDMYNVGTQPPYTIYRWTGNVWESQGAIGMTINDVTTTDIDTMWSGTNPTGSQRYLDNTGLWHLINNKVQAGLATKVDAVSGKVLSDNNLTGAMIAKWDDAADDVETLKTSKVDAAEGYGLSQQNYTQAEKTKLAGITITNGKVTNIPLDSELSTTSTNPVQNKAVATKFDTIDTSIATLSTVGEKHTANFATVYSANATYAVGDICIYNNDLYQCRIAIASAEAFNSSHWTKLSVGTLIDNLSDASLHTDGSKGTLNPVTNLNNFRNGVGLFTSSGCTNVPTGKSGANTTVVVIALGAESSSSNNVIQIAFSLYGNDSAASFLPKTRRCINGSWGSWQELSGQHFNDLMALDGHHVRNEKALKNFDEFYTGITMFHTSQLSVYFTPAAKSSTGSQQDNRPWGSTDHWGMLISVASTNVLSTGSGSSTYIMNDTADMDTLTNASYTPTTCLQIVFDLNGTSTPKRRTMSSSKWTPWVEIDQADLSGIVPTITGFIRQDGTAGNIASETTNADNFLNGITLFNSGSGAAAHLPSTESWILFAGGNATTTVQYAFPLLTNDGTMASGWTHSGDAISGGVSRVPKRRNRSNGTWTEWVDVTYDMHYISFDQNPGRTLTANEKTYAMDNMGLGNVATLDYGVVTETGGASTSGISTQRYVGKKLSIMGDSVSTYIGYVPVDTSLTGTAQRTVWYKGNNCGVSSVNETWWMRLITTLGMTLEVNESWSGSRVTSTDSEDGIQGAGCGDYRTGNLGNPDVIIIYLGINDFNNEVALGTWNGTSVIPTTTTTFREAYAIMLNKVMTNHPLAELWCCTLPNCERNGATGFPEINDNGISLNQFNDAIREIAHIFGAHVMEYGACGITSYNLSTYAGDWDSSSSRGLHPNASGHALIANQAIRTMSPTCGIVN